MKLFLESLEDRLMLNGTSLLSDGDFETQVPQWDSVFGNLELSDVIQFEGQNSAQGSSRANEFAGIYTDITGLVREGVEYEVSAWVRIDDRSGQTVRLGIERFDSSGYAFEELETRESLPRFEWRQLTGKFKVDSLADLDALKIKIEGPEAGVNFFVDDVRLFDPRYRLNTNLIQNDSLEFDAGGWAVWGSELAQTNEDAFHGSGSIKVFNRIQNWSGAFTNLAGIARPGFTYQVTVKVQVENFGGQNIGLGVKQVDASGEQYTGLDWRSGVVSDQWLTLTGEFDLNVVGDLSLLELFINGPDPGVNFYIDDVALTSVSLLPNSSFESGGFTGFVFAGTGTVQDSQVKVGQNALLVSNRTDQYAGPFINVLQTFQIDRDYEVGAWVRVSGNSDQEIRLGLKQFDERGERYIWIDERSIPSNQWVWMEGGFRYASVGETTSLELLVFLPDPGVDIYIDGIEISERDWRTETDARIEHFRKRDLQIQFVDEAGNAVDDVQWELQQIENEFAFGSAVTSELLTIPEYRDFFLEYYNWATIQYEIQWEYNERNRGQEDYQATDQLVQFLNENEIPFRAHALFWGEDIRRPTWFDQISDDELFAEMIERVASAGGRYAGQVSHWDVNNEMIQNSYFRERLGDWVPKWMFEELRRTDPNATLMTNEYFALAWRNTYRYLDLVEGLLADGVPLDAIGIQSHYSTDIFQNPTPTGIRHKLDKFDDFGLPIWITEFDSKNAFVTERAKDFDAFYRAIFSHPGVDGSLMWGFWEGNQWDQRGPLLDLDFTINETGQTYIDLRNEWTTFNGGSTGSGNVANTRGFHGSYLITATRPDGTTTTQTFELVSGTNQRETITVRFPGEVPRNEIVIVAAGETGTEIVNVAVDGVYAGQLRLSPAGSDFYSASPGWTTYRIALPEGATPGRVDLRFINDGLTSEGLDRNVRVDYIRVNGLQMESEFSFQESGRVWKNSVCETGFLNTEFISCEGFLRFLPG